MKKLYKKLGWIGIASCGLCCALPLIGTAIGMASVAAVAFYLEKIGIAALILAAFFYFYSLYKTRKKNTQCATACDVSCECKPDLKS